jgi:plastocyanin
VFVPHSGAARLHHLALGGPRLRKTRATIMFRSVLVLTMVGATLALSACGESATVAGPKAVVTWYPSTPLPSPGRVQASTSPVATAVPARAIGQGQTSGLGAPVANISATDQLAFDPTTVTAKTGGVIQWKDAGSTAHNVTFDGQPSLTSGTLQKGDTWQVQFTTAGTYPYHCTFHPGMNGQITVAR